MKDEYLYSNNLNKKIEQSRSMKVNDVICFWSDLLGFGNVFFEKNWKLNEKEQKKIYNRLKVAHSEFLRNTSPNGEKSLVLNDGLVKVGLIDELIEPDIIGLFLRGCIFTHLSINEKELESNFPGCRSILSFGQSINYIEDEIKFDDYVFNYTKPNPNGMSSLASKNGNPTIVYNPSPFQMNTAFSKSYILDSLGSKYGIEKNKIYIDQSIIDFTKELAIKYSFEYRETNKNGITEVLILKEENFPSFGFEFDKIIEIEYKEWKTKVYRLKSFYPHDEDMREFKIDV
jgi:hypothetical protein